jgi:hypothetical protein
MNSFWHHRRYAEIVLQLAWGTRDLHPSLRGAGALGRTPRASALLGLHAREAKAAVDFFSCRKGPHALVEKMDDAFLFWKP